MNPTKGIGFVKKTRLLNLIEKVPILRLLSYKMAGGALLTGAQNLGEFHPLFFVLTQRRGAPSPAPVRAILIYLK